jgi:metallo-beta-lactamase class B
MKSCLVLSLLLLSCCARAQSTAEWRSWNQPVEPFRVVGNVYYVGASDVTAFLITSPEGHILLDGGFAETAPQVRDNIRKLGFKVGDVKYLLNSHAHSDHAGGLAALKKWSGAALVASRADSAQLEHGGRGDFAWGDQYTYPPVTPDRIVADGESLTVGDAVMVAHITPGHTRGCTTWTTHAKEGGRTLDVVFACSTTAPGYKLVNNSNYPNIVDDFRHTFETLGKLPCDVMLGAHGSMFHLNAKRRKLHSASNPFIDPGEPRAYVEQSRESFEVELKKQQQP